MLTIRLSAKRSSRYPTLSFLRRTFFCLLALLGPIALRPVQGQNLWSPCPNVFSNEFSPHSNQWVGYVELQGIHIGQLVKLNVDLSMGIPISQNNVGSINLVKSGEQTFVDIENNLPAQYRIDIQLKNVIPNVLAISVNGQTICTGPKATAKEENAIKLQHAFLAQKLPFANGNGNGKTINNVRVIQSQLSQSKERRFSSEVLPTLVVPTNYVVTPQSVVTEPNLATGQPARSSVSVTSAEEAICGKPAQFYNLLSINGTRSQKGQFPWASPIFETSSSNTPNYICGSTIIRTTLLVTAAHCMYVRRDVERNPNDVLTVPGMYNIDNFLDADLQERKVAKIYIHKDYYHDDTGLAEPDIAVLKLDQPIVYDDVVRPICLWDESNDLEDIVGVKGYVSGWGITDDGEAKYPSYVTATVVDRRSCVSSLDKVIIGSSRLFCGDGHGSVPCNGDSGSGLVIKRGPKYVLRGVVSVGLYDPKTLKCARDKYVLYTDIAPLRYWLLQITRGT